MKAAIYCRLSEEDRHKQSRAEDSESIRNQKSLLVQYALDRQWEVYNIYSDDDYAGADRKRPEFNRLLADAEAHKFEIVLCKSQSRFTRELEIVEKYIHGLFPVWGIRFISVVDNADTENKGNKKSRQINGLINEWYLEDMSESIKSVLTNRRKNGLHIGSFALYGYKKDPERKGRLIIDEEAAETVREVFGLFAQGYGKTAIARILNDRGVPNPAEYKRRKRLRYKAAGNTLWKYPAIASMLTNEIYIGNMVQGRYGSVSYKTKQNKALPREQWIVVENTHEPIIDRQLWDKVQELIRMRHRPFIVGEAGVFAKKAVCAGCGCVMRSSKNRGRHYLKCATKHVSKNACEGAFISVDALEKAVIGELRAMNAEYLDEQRLARLVRVCDSAHKQRERVLAEISAYERRIAEYGKGIMDSYMDKVRGTITESEYLEFTRAFALEKERFTVQAEAAKARLADIERKTAAAGGYGLSEYINPRKLDRLTVQTMIEYITIGRRVPLSNRVPIEIHWGF